VGDRSQRRRLAGAAVAASLGLACADAASPQAQVCAQILRLQVPGAELVEGWPGVQGVALDYRLPAEDAAALHRIECVVAEPERRGEPGGAVLPDPGGLRAQSLRIDGRELSEAELLLVNSELLLEEIRRADPGAPRPPVFEATRRLLRTGAVWIEAALSKLAHEALSTVEAWRHRPREAAQEPAGADARG
jgi:hypothetical protein